MHRRRAREITFDLVDRVALVAGEIERQARVERGDEAAVEPVPDPRLLRRDRALPRDEPHLHAKELVEDESALGRRHHADVLGLMDRAVGGIARLELEVGPASAGTGSAKPRFAQRLRASCTILAICQVAMSAFPDCG